MVLDGHHYSKVKNLKLELIEFSYYAVLIGGINLLLTADGIENDQ